MGNKPKFEKLLEPFHIRQVRLRNRIVRTPCAIGFGGLDGYVSDADKVYFEAVARGGTGLLVAGASYVEVPLGMTGLHRFWVNDDKFIPGLKQLTEVIHKHGCPTFLELQHAGPSFPSHLFDSIQPVSSSSLSEAEMPVVLGVPRRPSRGLTIAEIEDVITKFADAAERSQKAGFDGIVLEGCHAFLINSFLSRAFNKRQDQYGCQNMENRTRFAVEIIRAIKERVGQDFPVGFRINGVEWGLENGITSEESQAFARILEKAGADYFDVSGQGHEPDFGFIAFPEQLLYPEPSEAAKPFAKEVKKGLLVPSAAAIKKVVSVPVEAVGRLDCFLGEDILRKGKADLIGFGRRLIADPELPNKLAAGRFEDIVPCMACLECRDRTADDAIRCRVNPTFGKGQEQPIKPAEKKKRVMVLGGGPAGMEAARVAAIRGHEVLLYEKERKLGGLLPLAALVKGLEIEDLPSLVRYLSTQTKKVGVKVVLGKEADLALIQEIKPDVVILATGGVFETPEIPGIKGANVVSSSLLRRKVKVYLRFLGPKVMGWLTKYYLPVGKRVVVIGGLIHGCEAAEFLVKRGRKVTIVEASDQLGVGIAYRRRLRFIVWLAKKGVATLTGVTYNEITDKGLTVTTKEGKRQTIEADTVLITLPPKADTGLFQTLDEKVPEVFLIGDCKEPGLVADAIAEGSRIGRMI